ncbi:MAG: phosphatidylserine/phosphatidylglycerophosphate/cardiolipin synthase family protein [SAR324 cluster bacterium]|nr:phosphatidylserine/phosphatidylglycerophosphate/cardiolipin synthase family protein [SAR324 cluster bacterium]
MNHLYRRIFKTQSTGVETLRELLETMFVSELLKVGISENGNAEIWLVSPWISNVVLVDNRTGNFDTLNPEWGRTEIRLSDILVTLMDRGTTVIIVTLNVESNQSFLVKLNELVQEYTLDSHLKLILREKLHTKGILLTRCLLLGSMNLTHNGININDEFIEYIIDQEAIASTKLEFQQIYEEEP